MPRWKTVAIAASIVLLFLVVNRGAYKGYFQDDDLDNLAWNSQLDSVDYLKGLVSPVFSRNNFRPVGHFYFHVMERLAGLRFAPYVAVLQFFHLANCFLVWLILRRLKMHPLAALSATLFFLYHPATFDAYWQPMYVFDVLCGTFCLLSFFAFIDRRWVLSFICFVCAYKAKEIAVMLPAVLAAYEFLLGEKKWKPLVLFFLVSLLFGIQALVSNANTHDAYTLKVTPETLWENIRFYAPGLFLIVILSSFKADRHWFFGSCAAVLFLIPLLMLPGRTFSVYLYVPLIGATVVWAGFVQRTKPWVGLLLLGLWLPFTFVQMREYRKGALTAADNNRSYVKGLAEFTRVSPQTSAFLEDGAPPSMHPWGIDGAIRYLSKKPKIQLAAVDEPEARTLMAEPNLAVLSWDQVTRTLQIARRDPRTPFDSYISMRRGMPVWQFGDGWYQRENFFRWTKPTAKATLGRSPDATHFEVLANIGPVHIHDVSKIELEVFLDGISIGKQAFTEAGWQKRLYDLKPGPAGVVNVEFRTTPEFRPRGDPRILGIAVGGFGFVK